FQPALPGKPSQMSPVRAADPNARESLLECILVGILLIRRVAPRINDQGPALIKGSPMKLIERLFLLSLRSRAGFERRGR
ncbi:MAG: hypothetical protein QG597_4692, partial [Actinomycetota bacterium]|nr:hypothetical protein [Actinomycetota bacterium]